MNTELTAKRLGLLKELLPSATRIAVLVNPTGPEAEALTQEAQTAVLTMGRQIELLSAATNGEIDSAYASLVQRQAEALLVTNSNLFVSRIVQLATLSVYHKVPTIHYLSTFVRAGGLMAYGPTLSETNHQAGIYVGRILKGEKASDLPVMRPTKFELVINRQTARTLGLTVPPTLFALATEVIE